jgi:crotonobetainyl-CoA:carnitine CoA-transferase CaiB-like acyl-CoA transferase
MNNGPEMRVAEGGPPGPLDGVRVLDASQMLAGPICGMRLGDLGADVLKIEPPGGEHNRSHGFGSVRVAGETPTFMGLNRNKRSVVLDLKQPAGLAAFLELARTADVLIQNYRVGTAERLGIGWEQLRAVNPRLVYAQISGYGENGPLRDRPGQDLLLQALSGSMWAVGSADDPPQPGALWAADVMTGYQAAIGILAALHARDRTGEGQKVSVSMLGVLMDCQVQELTTYLNAGVAFERPARPSAHSFIPAPYGVYRTADGWMVLAMAPLPALGAALGDPRLEAMTGEDDGVTRRDEITAILDETLAARTTAEWIELFDRHRLWAGPVSTYADLANHPQVEAEGMIATIQHPAGAVRIPAPPLRLSGTPPGIRHAPPRLGADTGAVLQEWLGWDDAAIREAASQGAFGSGQPAKAPASQEARA